MPRGSARRSPGKKALAGPASPSPSATTGTGGGPSRTSLRAELETAVRKELLGPAGGDTEPVTEATVRDRYLVGMLAPLGQVLDAAENDTPAVGGRNTGEEGPADIATPQRDTTLPSSRGLSFCVAGDTTALVVTARWGRYRRQGQDEGHEGGDPGAGVPGTAQRFWQRTQIAATSPPILLQEGALAPWNPVPTEQPEVVVRGVARKNSGDWIVTLFLVNGQTEQKRLRDEKWLFQVELLVEAPHGEPVFRRRPYSQNLARLDPVALAEERAMSMLYRREVEFAVGHGVAVHADLFPADLQRAVRLRTEAVPVFEVPRQTPPTPQENPELAPLVTDMQALAEASDAELQRGLAPLPLAYASWIQHEQRKIADPKEGLADHQQAAKDAVANCSRTLVRIRDGIALLAKSAQAAEAFRFSNRAMALQRVRSLYAQEVRRGRKADLAALDIPDNRRWYPFQLAFILLNLPGITELAHPDRREPTTAVADLLWFPTGGGKTEAYLGLAAYTLAIRRLQGLVEGRPGEHGVAVLMRYTLRLLTLQQFQRAAALICACESIRHEAILKGDLRWGGTPFRLGLWVGKKTTPNTTQESAEAITQAKLNWSAAGGGAGGGWRALSTPVQLTSCPWCGITIDPGQHVLAEPYPGRARTFIWCGDPLGKCPFSRARAAEGLPVLVVDEEIYRTPPALLISTVDKFAQLPWNGATQILFGQAAGLCPRHGFITPEIEEATQHPIKGSLPAVKAVPCAPLRPPDLIIQDELHLISGPLGTLVGLYETAIEELCSWRVNGHPVRPKLIASTATIRRATDQVAALFERKVEVFPPHGTDVRDNFFSVVRPPSDRDPGRRYIGICATGKRLKVAHIRVYTALLSAAQQLFERNGAAADPWMTLVGYFNSMRELGGTRRLVDDDIRSRLTDMHARGLARRRAPHVEELTSRIGSGDIPRILDLLEVEFEPVPPPKGAPRPDPIDVLLATNMISVGVDVKRLGLMVVAGQPKTTAEYIQATSRIGRTWPGLVYTVFNWARPRDLSHYERFEHYHATFYKHVEPLSVTPFASRAQDRGLAALLVALIRLAGADFNENAKAEGLDPKHPCVARAVDAIAWRAGRVLGSRQAEADVRAVLKGKIDVWLKEAARMSGGARLGYKDKRDGVTKGLLRPAGVGPWSEFTCLNSLRDVEPTMGLLLDDRGLDENPAAGGVAATGAGDVSAPGGMGP
ncbi:MAG: helicase [Planctomycetes bacterium]|nr:helicase [Planctomycetota bacterium]